MPLCSELWTEGLVAWDAIDGLPIPFCLDYWKKNLKIAAAVISTLH